MPSVLITGASRGIGRACALRLADAGWKVYAGVRTPEQGAALQSERPAGQIRAVPLDLRDEKQIADLPEVIGGALDALVNNAGLSSAVRWKR